MSVLITNITTALLFAVLWGIGVMPMESQANEGKDLFLSNDDGEMLAFNSGVRGKPPYSRRKMHKQQKKNLVRKKNIKSVEMSALEIDQGRTAVVPSQISKKNVRGGHPDRAKRHSYR